MLVKKIPLTQGKFALVDNKDYPFLKNYRWRCQHGRNTTYAISNKIISRNPIKYKTIRMHREIMNPLKDQYVDHKNHNGLDNTRNNLRVCSNSQNHMNEKVPINNTSGYKGVCFHKYSQKFQATIVINQKQIHLGYFDTPQEAAYVYNQKAKELFGDFAFLNEVN